MQMNTSTKKLKIIMSVLFIAVFVGLLLFLFYGENFNVLKEMFNKNATKESVQTSVNKLGFRAYFVVGILAMIQVVFTFIPAEPLHVVSGIGFGLWRGIAVCFVGILLGNTIIYLLNKIYGQKLKDFFASNINFDFNAARASSQITLLVIILYCLPAIPYGIICFFAASMNLKYPKYILITGLGSIPSLFLDVGLGHITMATSWAVSIIVFAVIIVLLILMWKFKTQIFNKVNQWIDNRRQKEKNRVGKFNPFVYGFAGNMLYTYVRSKVKIKLKSNVDKIEEPSIVLCNHGAFYDFAYAGKILMKHKPHFVVARMYFHHKILKYVLESTGAFPKSMFTNDVESLRNCIKVISNKQVLAMMPEARLSTVGKFEGVQESTYKFIKKMAVPVYVIKINGSYLAKPKWADKIRKGSYVEAELNQVYSTEELKEDSLEDIKQKIDTALDYNEWEWLATHPEIKYRTKNIAKGLENVLCICPKCGEKYTFDSDKNILTCCKCGLNVELDNRYQLNGVDFKNIAEWYDWQQNQIKSQIESDDNFCLRADVELRHLSKDGKSFTRHAGKGTCIFDKSGLRYVGTDGDKDIDKLFAIESGARVLFGSGEDFEIYENEELYYFVPENKKMCVEWYIVSEILKKEN